MWGPGGPSCIIRFICVIPAWLMGTNGIKIYNSVRHLGSIYDAIPNGRSFLHGLQIVGIAGCTTLTWNFILFAASPFCRGYLLGTIGLIDLGLAIALIAGVAKQGQFLPGTYGSCHGAADWKNGTDGRNFFLVANGTQPDGICHQMVKNWAVAISVIGFYLICFILNSLLGFGDHGPHHNSWGDPPQYDCNCVPYFIELFPYFIELLLRLLKPVLYVIDHPLAGGRFAIRCISKAFGQTQRNKNIHPRKPKKEAVVGEGQVLPYDIVVLIAQKLHYADLVSLSRSSKRLRTAFFGDVVHLEELRQYTCEGVSKSQCNICNIQTCEACGVKVRGATITGVPPSHYLSTLLLQVFLQGLLSMEWPTWPEEGQAHAVLLSQDTTH